MPLGAALGARVETGDEIGERHVAVDVMADLHLASRRQHGAARIGRAIRQREIGVGEDDAEQQQQVGLLHQLGHRRIAGGAEISAGNDVGRRLHQAAAHEGGDHRQRQLARQRRHLFLDAVAAHFDVHHQHRRFGTVDAGKDLFRAFGKRFRVGGALRQHRHRLDLGVHHVAGKLDIDRQRLLKRAAQHARDIGMRRGGIGQHGLVAGKFLEDRELAVDGARLMMQQEAAGALARARRAGDHHHRRALGIGAGDRIDQVEGAGAIGDHGNAEAAVIAHGGIGGEADRRLMAEGELRQDAGLFDHLVERQHEIARDAEDLPRAVILQALEQRGGERGHDDLPYPAVASTRSGAK